MLTFALTLLILLCWFVLKPNKYDFRQSFNVRVLAYSKSASDVMAVSFYLMYPRFIHSEMMTHKDFSRSAASSRAIPVKKMLSQVWNQPAMPVYWGANIPGMQAKTELKGWRRHIAINLWMLAGKVACVFAWFLTTLNLHKQIANRILEPWQLMHVTLTTAKLANFFNLRIHPDAQPEICYLAEMMQLQFKGSPSKLLKKGEWHLPWVDYTDQMPASKLAFDLMLPLETVLVRISAARCARSSYATFDGARSIEKDLQLYARLIVTKPVHASPAEHQVTPDTKTGVTWDNPELAGNMIGWIQHRKQIPEHYYEG
jgi:thymidylate synthase ThyX